MRKLVGCSRMRYLNVVILNNQSTSQLSQKVKFSLLDPSEMKVHISIQCRFFSYFVCYHLENKGVFFFFFQLFTFQNRFQFVWLRLIMLDVSTFPIFIIMWFWNAIHYSAWFSVIWLHHHKNSLFPQNPNKQNMFCVYLMGSTTRNLTFTEFACFFCSWKCTTSNTFI